MLGSTLMCMPCRFHSVKKRESRLRRLFPLANVQRFKLTESRSRKYSLESTHYPLPEIKSLRCTYSHFSVRGLARNSGARGASFAVILIHFDDYTLIIIYFTVYIWSFVQFLVNVFVCLSVNVVKDVDHWMWSKLVMIPRWIS